MSPSAKKVLIVGLGNAGMDHARALESFPHATVIAGVDRDSSRGLTFRKASVPVYAGIFEAASKRLHPDIVVVATSTRSHSDVCTDVAEYFPEASILVEKPAADNLEDALHIVEGVAAKQSVDVAYHMAFSPEVEWALKQVRARAGEFGPATVIEARYADPYQADLTSARARLGSSWLDSGINALSVIERFADLVARKSLRPIGPSRKSVFEGRFICEAEGEQLPATVLTSWYSSAPSRTTRIRYSSGAELVMDHHAVLGYLFENGALSAIFGSDGAVPRRVAHYQALYDSLLCQRHQPFPIDTSVRLHRLLLEPKSTL